MRLLPHDPNHIYVGTGGVGNKWPGTSSLDLSFGKKLVPMIFSSRHLEGTRRRKTLGTRLLCESRDT